MLWGLLCVLAGDCFISAAFLAPWLVASVAFSPALVVGGSCWTACLTQPLFFPLGHHQPSENAEVLRHQEKLLSSK